ncbi:hypothetical protein O3M35_002200 [Rhynocoris fuscipes]|uniref:Uncharacterized protein n=1 Tax=Rhynocoris fuscipes TaxID=488301 RepID=A0AAW1CRP1_9HEMI
MVFPDSDLCHSISEKEFGSCREFGCKPIGRFNYTNEDQGLRQFAACSSKCMLTDTEKYVFKSCFKDIQSQIENFDRYRGAETPGGEASLYDVNESSPVDTRKLYRKNFTDLKLNMWYNYVYHSAQLARDAGANSFANCGLTNSLPNFHKLIADNFLLKYLTAEELILKFTQFIDVRLQDDVVPAGSLPDQKHGIYFHIEKASSP